MKRLLLLLLCWMWASPALAVTLLNVGITAAQTNALGQVLQLRGTSGTATPNSIGIQCNFTYGSGGTTAVAYVQTSLDGGTTWQDVATCSFALASLRQIFNVTSNTTVTTPVASSDGALAANTAVSGVFGNLWRVKWSSTGTYAGTTLRIDAVTNALTAQ